MIPLDQLQRYPLFADIDDNALSSILDLMELEDLPDGTVVVREGEMGDKVYFLWEGSVTILVNDHKVTQLEEGAEFGEMYLIDVQPRSATVRADGRIKLLSLENSRMPQIKAHSVEAYITLLTNCARAISRRLRDMNARFPTMV